MNKTTTSQTKATQISLQRILNVTALAIIVLSVLAQCIGLAMALNNSMGKDITSLVFFFGMLSFSIIPGTLLAFAKFLLNVIRSFKTAAARMKALVYLVATLWPLVTAALISANAMHLKHLATGVAPGETQESEQFLAGRDWATRNHPVRDAECTGSHDFRRGCWSYLAAHRHEQFLAGQAWARENLPAKASACSRPGIATHVIVGCRNYFFEHLAKPKPAGQGQYEGMTTAECQAEVNANYEVSEQLDLETGNMRSIEVTRRRNWIPELRDCENYDKLAENTLMPHAYDRLQKLLDKMKTGHVVSDEERAEILKDFTAMSKVHEQPYKTAYFKLFDEYSQRREGEYKEPVIVYPKISCEEYQAKIDEMKRTDNERVAAMNALKRADGVVTDGARHSQLNQQRIAMLWDWKLYTDGARAAGCEIRTK